MGHVIYLSTGVYEKYLTCIVCVVPFGMIKTFQCKSSSGGRSERNLELRHKSQFGRLSGFYDALINKQLDPCMPE